MGDHRHKREAPPRSRRTRLAGASVLAGAAVAATATAVTLGVVVSGPGVSLAVGTSQAGLPDPTPLGGSSTSAAAPSTSPRAAGSAPAAESDRARTVSRSRSRLVADVPAPLSRAATITAVRHATTHRWATTDLNLWALPGSDATQVGEVDSGARVLVTGRTLSGRDEVVVGGKSRWVTDGYLSDDKPLQAASGLSMAPCPDTGVEYRLTAGAVYLYRSVCHAFPQITTYGGYAPRGEHASGKALDIMTSDVTLGTTIADWLMAHASELDIYDIIWRQHIWTPERASEGWRLMPDRGSETANHYDHVHVSVN